MNSQPDGLPASERLLARLEELRGGERVDAAERVAGALAHAKSAGTPADEAARLDRGVVQALGRRQGASAIETCDADLLLGLVRRTAQGLRGADPDPEHRRRAWDVLDIVRSPSLRGIAEEAPGAYKDVGAVVDAAHETGLSSKVARLEPLVCVKG